MAEQSWWEANALDKQMWQRVIGRDSEDIALSASEAAVILADIPVGERALEIGAGVGRLLRQVAKHFKRVDGVDYSLSLCRLSEKYLKDELSCHIICTDGFNFPFSDGEFDFVYSLVCFHHMPTLEMVQCNIRETYRVLRPNGLCRIQTIPCINDGWHFTEDEFWNEFEQVGFEKVKLESGLLHPIHFWVTARKSV